MSGQRHFLSRREFLRNAAIAAATIGSGTSVLRSLLSRQMPGVAYAAPSVGKFEERYASSWKTWVLGSAGEIRLPPPTSTTSLQINTELARLQRAQRERTEAQITAARYWDTGPATRRWTEIQLDMIKTHRPNPPRASRGLALAHIAMYDALIAAWHFKYLFNYPAPSGVDPTLTSVVRSSDSPSYPSEHSVVAGAAARVLEYLFPQQGSGWFESKAQEAAMSRIWAGIDWPNAVEQGMALGRMVADKVLARAKTDRSDTVWDGKRHAGICYWKPTPPAAVFPPLEPSWGKVNPWLLVSADLLRPGPPPMCGSAEEREQFLEVYRTVNALTEEQKRIASFWNDGPGTFTPPGHWYEMALELVGRYNLNTPRAARIFAYLGVVVMAAGICVWDAKYAYWSPRPITYIQDYVDPRWTSFIPTPPFPGYVSGHSGFSGGAAELLGYAFPEERAMLRSRAAEAAMSRLYGGIHIRADNEVGLAMGNLIGAVASARALNDDVANLVGRALIEPSQRDSLSAKLDAAVAKANQKNFKGAIRDLQAFVSQLDAVAKPADREPLVAAAREIIAQFSVVN